MKRKIELFFKNSYSNSKKCMSCFYESIKVHDDQPQYMGIVEKTVQSRKKREEKGELLEVVLNMFTMPRVYRSKKN